MKGIEGTKAVAFLKWEEDTRLERLDCCLVTESGLTLRSHAEACQAPFSMGFPRKEQWSGFPFPSSGTLIEKGEIRRN